LKESEFIKQNKKRWNDFENELKSNRFNPQRVADHYIKIVDDLSYARTHYPNRLIRSYLNGVSQILSLRIYKTQKGLWQGIKQFWKTDLPLIMFNARKELLISFLIFVLAVAVGAFSNWSDPEFVRFIISDSYVDMTLENIEKGDPMGVYKDEEMASMFFRITLNNIMVSAYVFLLGMVFGIGTIGALVYNGIMLGAFQQFFFAHDLGIESLLTVWQHGTIEISCIIIAGAAGLALSNGILFPGTYSRIDAFRISGRKGLMMMLGLMPLLVYSGFIEAVITRLTDVHWAIRLGSILGSLFFVIFYFIWYPHRIAKNKVLDEELKINLQPLITSGFDHTRPVSNAVIAGEGINRFQKNRKAILTSGFVSIVLLTLYITLDASIFRFGSDLHWREYALAEDFLVIGSNLKVFVINLVLLFAALLASTLALRGTFDPSTGNPTPIPWWFLGLSAIVVAMLTTNIWSALAIPLWLPLSSLYIQSSFDPTNKGQNLIAHTIHLFRGGWRAVMMLSLAISILCGLVLYMNDQFILPLVAEGIYRFIPSEDFSSSTFLIILSSILVLSLYFVAVSFVSTCLGLSYFGIKENTTATNLLQSIDNQFDISVQFSSKRNILNKSKIS